MLSLNGLWRSYAIAFAPAYTRKNGEQSEAPDTAAVHEYDN